MLIELIAASYAANLVLGPAKNIEDKNRGSMHFGMQFVKEVNPGRHNRGFNVMVQWNETFTRRGKHFDEFGNLTMGLLWEWRVLPNRLKRFPLWVGIETGFGIVIGDEGVRYHCSKRIFKQKPFLRIGRFRTYFDHDSNFDTGIGCNPGLDRWGVDALWLGGIFR